MSKIIKNIFNHNTKLEREGNLGDIYRKWKTTYRK